MYDHVLILAVLRFLENTPRITLFKYDMFQSVYALLISLVYTELMFIEHLLIVW